MSSPSSNNAGDNAWLMKIEMKREELGEIKKGDKIKKAAEDHVPQQKKKTSFNLTTIILPY